MESGNAFQENIKLKKLVKIEDVLKIIRASYDYYEHPKYCEVVEKQIKLLAEDNSDEVTMEVK